MKREECIFVVVRRKMELLYERGYGVAFCLSRTDEALCLARYVLCRALVDGSCSSSLGNENK